MKAPMEMNKNLLTLSKSDSGAQTPGPYTGLAASKGPGGPRSLCNLLAAKLMIGFWFGIGVVLAVKTLEGLKYCISRKC